jgi:hypothetical protein
MDTKYSQRKIENELMANIMEKFLMFWASVKDKIIQSDKHDLSSVPSIKLNNKFKKQKH